MHAHAHPHVMWLHAHAYVLMPRGLLTHATNLGLRLRWVGWARWSRWAAGMAAVNWSTMTAIAASWVISPVLGGLIAALFLALIKSRIIYQEDKIAAARKWVPILVGISLFALVLSARTLAASSLLPSSSSHTSPASSILATGLQSSTSQPLHGEGKDLHRMECGAYLCCDRHPKTLTHRSNEDFLAHSC